MSHQCAREGCCRHEGASGPWLPFSDLLSAAGYPSQGELARRVGVSTRTIVRWAARGEVPLEATDAAAIGIGLNPICVWGYEWSRIGDEAARTIDPQGDCETVSA